MTTPLAITKGHGTGNDFVLIADPDGELDLGSAARARLCDRHFGVGGDGVIRAVRSARLPDGAAALSEDGSAEWFLDYSNADGSSAEMCGNGIRVYGEFLVSTGLAEIEIGQTLSIGTRAGVRRLTRLGDGWAADLGAFHVTEGDALVSARGMPVDRPGLQVDVGNPHIVVALAADDELDSLELASPPVIDPAPHGGANVEFVVPADPLVEDGVGGIRMRVHERGSGETLSCGTGAAAAALATRHWAGSGAPDAWTVMVPGGILEVRVIEFDGEPHVELAGPAVLVYSGQLHGDVG